MQWRARTCRLVHCSAVANAVSCSGLWYIQDELDNWVLWQGGDELLAWLDEWNGFHSLSFVYGTQRDGAKYLDVHYPIDQNDDGIEGVGDRLVQYAWQTNGWTRKIRLMRRACFRRPSAPVAGPDTNQLASEARETQTPLSSSPSGANLVSDITSAS